ncbi:MAG: hypothetical protein ACOCP4_05325 [Candidatus Woesearchaeota archaeon]
MIYAMTENRYFNMTHKWSDRYKRFVKVQDKTGVINILNQSRSYLPNITDVRIKG